MKIFELLEELKAEIENSPKTVFSGRRTIEADVFLEIVNDLIAAVPEEIKQANAVLEERDQIIEDAKGEASAIIKSADDELQERVSESAVLQEAQAQAADLKKTAENNAKEITIGAKEYADDILQELENYLGDYLKIIRKNRLQLTGKRKG